MHWSRDHGILKHVVNHNLHLRPIQPTVNISAPSWHHPTAKPRSKIRSLAIKLGRVVWSLPNKRGRQSICADGKLLNLDRCHRASQASDPDGWDVCCRELNQRKSWQDLPLYEAAPTDRTSQRFIYIFRQSGSTRGRYVGYLVCFVGRILLSRVKYGGQYYGNVEQIVEVIVWNEI